jgi:hypothetical protein
MTVGSDSLLALIIIVLIKCVGNITFKYLET